MKTIFVIITSAIVILFIFMAGTSICGAIPGSQYLQDPFVYPVDDGFAISTETGAYLVEGPSPTGCYLLTEPSAGQEYGSARWIWPIC